MARTARPTARIAAALIAPLALLGALAGCSQSSSAGGSTTSVSLSAASTSAATSAAPSSAQPTSAAPSVAASTTDATTPSSTATSSASSTAAATTSATATTTTSAEGGSSPVNVSRYTDSSGSIYFQSPSGKLRCGMIADGGTWMVGCQAVVRVANMPECTSPTTDNAPMVSMTGSGAAKAECTNQGVFITENARVLPYGSTLTAHGFTFTSTRQGVVCTSAKGNGFTASVQRFAALS